MKYLASFLVLALASVASAQTATATATVTAQPALTPIDPGPVAVVQPAFFVPRATFVPMFSSFAATGGCAYGGCGGVQQPAFRQRAFVREVPVAVPVASGGNNVLINERGGLFGNRSKTIAISQGGGFGNNAVINTGRRR